MNLRRHALLFALLLAVCIAGISCSLLERPQPVPEPLASPVTLALPPAVPAPPVEESLQQVVPPANTAEVTQENADTSNTLVLTGKAYWYGPGWHGRKTACGEVFDSQEMTAAHPFLPFQTVLRVENLATGKEALIRVTDRCGNKPAIDVSEGAAKALGFHHAGITKVRMTVVEWPKDFDPTDLIASLSEVEGETIQRNQVAMAEVGGQDSLDEPLDIADGETDGLERKTAIPDMKVRLTMADETSSAVRSKVRHLDSQPLRAFFATSDEELTLQIRAEDPASTTTTP